VNWLGFYGLGSGFSVFISGLFEDEGSAAEPGQGVKNANIIDGVVDQLVMSEGFEDLADGELVGGLVEFDDVVILNEV
jgi:hypothetical protein